MNGLFQLWSNWLSGNLPPDTVLWGLKLVWWARVGKLAQFIGGVTIIADIIGPEKIRSFGTTLHSTVKLDSVLKFYREVLTTVLFIFKLILEQEKFRGKNLYQTISIFLSELRGFISRGTVGSFTLITVFIVYPVLTFIVFYAINKQYVQIDNPVLGLLFTPFWIIFGSHLLVLVMVGIVALAGILLDLVFVEPIAWILERSSLERLVKILALLALLFGFHFDFLAS